MAQHVHGQSPDFLVTCYQRMRSLAHEQCRCRECGEYCSLTASLCETCGIQDPIRLPIAWGLVAVGICGAVFAIGMWIL